MAVCQDNYTALKKKWGGREMPSTLTGALKAGKGQGSQRSDEQKRAWSARERRGSMTSGAPERGPWVMHGQSRMLLSAP